MSRRQKDYSSKYKALIDGEMIESEVFRSLTRTSMWVLLRFYQKRKFDKRKRKIDYRNDPLVFTYPEAQHFGISKSTFARAIVEVVEKGFIDMEWQGGFCGRDYSRYKLSDRWKEYGTDRFVKVRKKRVLQSGLDIDSRIKAKEKREKPKLRLDWIKKCCQK